MFQSFDSSIFGIARGDAQACADPIGCLMMIRVYGPARFARDGRQQSVGFDFDLVGKIGIFGRIVPGRREMLPQRAARVNVQQLQTAADGEYRKIRRERLVEQVEFEGVPFVVGRLGSGIGSSAEQLGIDIRSSHEKQTGGAVQFGCAGSENGDGLNAGCTQGVDIVFKLLLMPVGD